MKYKNEIVPAKILPQGWMWHKYADGSGHLESPEGKQYMSYDLNTYEYQYDNQTNCESLDILWEDCYLFRWFDLFDKMEGKIKQEKELAKNKFRAVLQERVTGGLEYKISCLNSKLWEKNFIQSVCVPETFICSYDALKKEIHHIWDIPLEEKINLTMPESSMERIDSRINRLLKINYMIGIFYKEDNLDLKVPHLHELDIDESGNILMTCKKYNDQLIVMFCDAGVIKDKKYFQDFLKVDLSNNDEIRSFISKIEGNIDYATVEQYFSNLERQYKEPPSGILR